MFTKTVDNSFNLIIMDPSTKGTKQMKRKPGFYFVKRYNSWEPAYCNSIGIWTLSGLKYDFDETDFQEIKDEPMKLPQD